MNFCQMQNEIKQKQLENLLAVAKNEEKPKGRNPLLKKVEQKKEHKEKN